MPIVDSRYERTVLFINQYLSMKMEYLCFLRNLSPCRSTSSAVNYETLNLFKTCCPIKRARYSIRGTNTPQSGTKWSAVPLPCLTIVFQFVGFEFSLLKQGSGLGRGRSPVEWGDFPSVRTSVPLLLGGLEGLPARSEAYPVVFLTRTSTLASYIF